MICTCGTNKIFALVRSGKVRRLTFSRSLAEFIQNKNLDHEIRVLDLVLTKEVHEEHKGSLYGIVDKRKTKLLRATVSWEEALFLTQDPSRTVYQCKVRKDRILNDRCNIQI